MGSLVLVLLSGCQQQPPKYLGVSTPRPVVDVSRWPTSTRERLELVSPRDEPGVWFRTAQGELVDALHAWRVRRDGGAGERQGLVSLVLDGGTLEEQWTNGHLSSLQVFGSRRQLAWPPGARFDDAGEVEALKYARRASAVVDFEVANVVFSGDWLRAIEPSGRVHTLRFEGQQLASDFTNEPRPIPWAERVWSAGPDGVVATDADGGVELHAGARLFVVGPEHAALVEGQTLRFIGPSVDVAFALEPGQSVRDVVFTESGEGLVALEDEHTLVHFDARHRTSCRVKTDGTLQRLVRASFAEDFTYEVVVTARSRLKVDALGARADEVMSLKTNLTPCLQADGGTRQVQATVSQNRWDATWEPKRRVLRDAESPPAELDVECPEAPKWWGDQYQVVTFCGSRRELRVFERFGGAPQAALWKVKGPIDAFGVAGDVAWHSVANRAQICATRTVTGRQLWTGDERWSVKSDFHPILFEGLLVVGTEGEVMALDPLTGEVMWRTRVAASGCVEDATSPIEGTSTVLVADGDTTFAELELATGVLLWKRVGRGPLDGLECGVWEFSAAGEDDFNIECREDCASSCDCSGTAVFPSCRRDTRLHSATLVEFSVTGGHDDSCGSDVHGSEPCELEFVDSLTATAAAP